MIYYVKTGMKGNCPGSPDWDTYEVPEEIYDRIIDILKIEGLKSEGE